MDIQVNAVAGGPGGRWEPANDVERRLNAAVAADDLDEAMRILVAAPLVLPGFDDGSDAGTGRQRVLVREREGVPYLLVFTSVESMRRAVSAEGWRETSLPELVRTWPELSPAAPMGLAVNPTTPILMLVAPENVPMMASPPPDPRADFEPANEVEALLRDALVRSDPALLDVLVTARVIVLADGLEFDGVPAVVVFTSRQLCDEYLARIGLDVARVPMDLVAVLGNWPGPGYQLAVNPGSPIAFAVDGSRVPGLLGYAGDLIRERLPAPADGPDPAGRHAPTDRHGPVDRHGPAARHDPADRHESAHPAARPRHAHPDDVPDADDQPPVRLPSEGRIADLLRGWE